MACAPGHNTSLLDIGILKEVCGLLGLTVHDSVDEMAGRINTRLTGVECNDSVGIGMPLGGLT